MRLKESFSMNIMLTKHLMKASPWFLVLNLVNTVLDVFGSLFQMMFYQKIIDLIIYSAVSIETVAKYFFVYYLFNAVFFGVNHFVTDYFNQKEKVKIELYYKQMIYTETVRNELSCYNDSDYMNKLHNSIYHNGSYLYTFAFRIFSLTNAVLSLCGVGYIFVGLHPIFIAGALLVAIKNIIVSRKKNKINYQKYEDNLSLERDKTYVNNIFYLKNYARELRLYSIGKFFRKKFIRLYDLLWQINKKYYYKLSFVEIVNKLINTGTYIFNIILLVFLLRSNEITVGEFSLVLSKFASLTAYIECIIMFFSAIEDDAKYIKDILSVINKEKHEFSTIDSCCMEECIRFENVSYTYDGEKKVINNINLRIPFGKKIAIVGANGSGKSTFVKLLLGLYRPISGNISYNCRNVEGTCNYLFSTMFQDFQIYALSIAENIYPKYETEDMGVVMEAIKFSELEEKINSLSKGIHSQMTKEFDDEGVGFSGGEQQKVALARAYIGDRKILVLDEPSSSLDALAERKIMKKINDMADNRTVLLVTHNLLNTRMADYIYYFENGRVVESGTPDELLKLKGKYNTMLASQLKQLAGGEYE